MISIGTMINATNDIKCPIVEILKSEKGTLDKINNFNDFFGVPWWLLLMHECDKCDKMVNFRDIQNQKERFVSNQTVLDCTKKIKNSPF